MLKRVVALMIALTVLAGCTLNAGSAFAEQYEEYLDTVPEVDTYLIRGNNDLPANGSADTTVTLKDGLTEEQVAAVIAELSGHRVEQKIGDHRLTIRFPTPNGAGEQILVSVSLLVNASSGAIAADDAAGRVERITTFAAADHDLTDVTTGVDSIRATTSGDPFALADRLTALLTGESTEFYQVTASTEIGHVSFFIGDPIDALRPLTDVLTALPEGIEPTRWRATSQNADREPLFEIALPAGTPDDVVTTLQTAAQDVGIEVEITVAVG